MYATILNRPVTLYVLLALLVFLGLGGLYGGVAMLMNPSGALLGMDVSYLESVPVDDFMLPGLILVTAFGLCPMIAAYGAWARPQWALLQRLNPWPDYHWSRGWSQVIAVLLVLFIGLEFLMWGNASPLQPILLGVGLAILVMCGYPSIRRYLWVGAVTDLTAEGTETTESATDEGGRE